MRELKELYKIVLSYGTENGYHPGICSNIFRLYRAKLIDHIDFRKLSNDLKERLEGHTRFKGTGCYWRPGTKIKRNKFLRQIIKSL